MKWKILTVILAVVAVGAVATTIMVSKGYRFTKPEPQVATAPTTTPTPETQVTQPQVPPTTPPESASAAKPETKPEPAKAEKPAQPKPEAKAKPAANVKVETKTETRTENTSKQVSNTRVTTKTIPAGTNLGIALVSAVSSSNASVGDAVQATTTEALIVDGVELAPAGSAVTGKVTDVLAATRNKGATARLNLEFTSLATVGGSKSIHGTLLGGEKKAGSSTGKDAEIIVGSGVAGAVLGKVIGKTGKATAAGGVIGAAAGMGVAAMQKGYEVKLPAGTKLTIVLDNPVEVAVKR
jgi:hypothetical protein